MVRLKNCNVSEFLQLAEQKPVICICAGEKLQEFCGKFHLEKKILYAVDNFKGGQILRIGEADIPVRFMEQIDEGCRDALCVLTSMVYAEEIVHQMDGIPTLRGVEIYVYELLQEKREEMRWRTGEPQRIPKIIHYCWFGNGKMPTLFQENIESWKKYCPDYEITEWNERNYDISKNTYMRQAYEKKAWGFVPDYARLDIVNTYGGVYFDTDVRLLRSLDSLLQYALFCGFENTGSVAFGLGFGAEQNHPILRDMLQEYEELRFVNPDGSLNMVPSPVYQTSVLEKYGVKKNGQIQQGENFLVLSPEYFAPINEFGYGVPVSDTFSVHQYAATWYQEKQKDKKEKIMHNYEYVLKRIEG